MLCNPTVNFVLETQASIPADGCEGQLIYVTATQAPYIYTGGQWKPLGLLAGAAASLESLRYLGLVGAEEYGDKAFLWRNNGAIVKAHPTEEGEVLGWGEVGGVDTMVFQKISNWIGKQLQLGSFWVGTGPDAASSFVLPDVTGDTSPRLLQVDATSTHGISWTEVKALIPQAFKTAGAILVGTTTGGVYLTAPTADEVLVGDPTSSTGWRYKRIGDILPTESFTSASRIYANANLG
jgi:hypothetical protein